MFYSILFDQQLHFKNNKFETTETLLSVQCRYCNKIIFNLHTKHFVNKTPVRPLGVHALEPPKTRYSRMAMAGKPFSEQPNYLHTRQRKSKFIHLKKRSVSELKSSPRWSKSIIHICI